MHRESIFSNVAGLTQTREVANVFLDAQDMNANGVASWTIGNALLEGQWTAQAGDAFSYAGSADYVVINAQAHQTIPQNVGRARPAPVLELQRSINGGVIWTTIASGASGYIRDASDHEESSNSIFYRDRTPPAGVLYRLNKRQEALAGSVDLVTGQFDLEAVTNT